MLNDIRSAGEFAQDGVDHAGGEAVAGLLGQLHALVDCGAGGDAVQMEKLEGAQAEGDRISGSSLALGRLSSDWIWWSRRICQRSTPSTRAVARLRSAGERALTALPRSRSSEWEWPRSTAMRIWKAALRAGETAGIAMRLTVQPNRALVASEAAAQELGCRKTLFAFELEFEEFEPGIFGAADEEAVVFDIKWPGTQEQTRRDRIRRWPVPPQLPCDGR